ncbi:uncharacterized protein M421DRAFT_422877 [Didymella exigua CBS 183.55]|uniref:DUF4360 domain-containing protein n=1 Tax=Didymella exigua CBS 183.55 TaxID=1150837 RepID=A0A6A5REU5_9PLEO|nr:uncharacterized protein M421DRAFT_422877 [Didymella exigua CBS 183.55]KAF1926202.1 hypothetical protein M421DRAFT_422877 [Didymella exigua CBS 183.55]
MKLALPVAALASALPQTASTPPPSFKITNVVSGGTGCPSGSINVEWTDDAVLPIHFGPDFIAAVGPGVATADSRKFCQLNLALAYSAGFSFAVYSVSYTGFADVDAGVTGTVGSNCYFSGETDQTWTSTTLTGPARLDFAKRDAANVALWSPCSGAALFNVDASVALTPLAGSASGVLGIAEESGRLSNSLYVVWKKCEQT